MNHLSYYAMLSRIFGFIAIVLIGVAILFAGFCELRNVGFALITSVVCGLLCLCYDKLADLPH